MNSQNNVIGATDKERVYDTMKKMLIPATMIILITLLTACSSNDNITAETSAASETESENNPEPEVFESEAFESEDTDSGENETETTGITEEGENPEAASATETGNVLVAYFSKTGNTQTIADIITGYTGGEQFQIETAAPYPEDYNETVDLAREEQDTDARPQLLGQVENMEQYDVIFLGYPNWWGTMPMAMFTFLEEYDFAGKTIIPFCTHEGSALGSSESDIASLCPEAVLLRGLAVRGSAVDNASSDVVEWIESLGIIE